MALITLNPNQVISNNGWSNPTNIFSNTGGSTTDMVEPVEENKLLLGLSNTGLSSGTGINSIKVILNNLFIESKSSVEGLLTVAIKRGDEDFSYYTENTDFTNTPTNYSQTLRTEAGSGTPWTVSLVDNISLNITINNDVTTFPVKIGNIALEVNYNLFQSTPLELTSGIIKLTSGKITI